MDYDFTNKWFVMHTKRWQNLFSYYQPKNILEVGCYEGRSTCFIIETLGAKYDLNLDCVDPWYDSFIEVKKRFDYNILLAISKVPYKINHTIYQESSLYQLPKLLINGKKEYYDFIYIDGYHSSPFVLQDAILSLQLIKTDGIIVFDDYLWEHESHKEPQYSPALALNAFMEVYKDYITVIHKGWQLIIQKTRPFGAVIY